MKLPSVLLFSGLLLAVPASTTPVSASMELEEVQATQILSQVPGDYYVVYRRYRGDDEVEDDNRGRGRGRGRGGSSDGGGSDSGGGGTSTDGDKLHSGSGSAGGKSQSGSKSQDGAGDNPSDDSDRF